MEDIKKFKIKWNIVFNNVNFKEYPKISRKEISYPAIYSWQVFDNKNNLEAIYIGEASNLGRRFYNYKNPGSHQKTNKRIKKELIAKQYKNKLINFCKLEFDGLNFNKSLKITNSGLEYKSNRLIIEGLVILYYRGKSVKFLNK